MPKTSSSEPGTSTTPSTEKASGSTTATPPPASKRGVFWVGIVGSRNLGACACSSQASHWPPTASEQAHRETCPKATEWLRMLQIVGRLAREHENLGVVSGGAAGADTLAIDAAKTLGIPEDRQRVYPVRPGSDSFAQRAKRRNQQIVDLSDMLIAIFAPGPRSPGTKDSIARAQAMGITVHIWHDGSWHRE